MNEDRILSTTFGTFNAAFYDGQNRSGIQPLCDKVLILCDEAADKTAGDVFIPDSIQETTSLAATTGVLVACGPQAFAYDSNRLVHWAGERPEPGVRVFFQKYAGTEYPGVDGRLYRVMDDRCVAAMEIPQPVLVIPE